MALYAVCGTNEEQAGRALAILDAIAPGEALRKVDAWRRSGEMPWLPLRLRLTARRATKRESAALASFLSQRAPGAAVPSDAGATETQRRRSMLFHHLLWRGELDSPI